MIPCPDCKAKGNLFGIGCGKGGCKPMTLKCFRCEGVGEIPDEMLEWIKRGRLIKESRLRRDMPLREEAKRLGISASTYSDIEQGEVDNSKWQLIL